MIKTEIKAAIYDKMIAIDLMQKEYQKNLQAAQLEINQLTERLKNCPEDA